MERKAKKQDHWSAMVGAGEVRAENRGIYGQTFRLAGSN